jgi:hypothetical protein
MPTEQEPLVAPLTQILVSNIIMQTASDQSRRPRAYLTTRMTGAWTRTDSPGWSWAQRPESTRSTTCGQNSLLLQNALYNIYDIFGTQMRLARQTQSDHLDGKKTHPGMTKQRRRQCRRTTGGKGAISSPRPPRLSECGCEWCTTRHGTIPRKDQRSPVTRISHHLTVPSSST